jgi:hypothetical protein
MCPDSVSDLEAGPTNMGTDFFSTLEKYISEVKKITNL